MANRLVNKFIIKYCCFNKYKFFLLYLLFSLLTPNKINFSANCLETIIDNDIENYCGFGNPDDTLDCNNDWGGEAY